MGPFRGVSQSMNGIKQNDKARWSSQGPIGYSSFLHPLDLKETHVGVVPDGRIHITTVKRRNNVKLRDILFTWLNWNKLDKNKYWTYFSPNLKGKYSASHTWIINRCINTEKNGWIPHNTQTLNCIIPILYFIIWKKVDQISNNSLIMTKAPPPTKQPIYSISTIQNF